MSQLRKTRAIKRDPRAKYKVAAIPALLLVLAGVLFSNFTGSSDSEKPVEARIAASKAASSTTASPSRRPTRPTGQPKVNSAAEVVTNKSLAKPWPVPTTDFLTGPNPFEKLGYEPARAASPKFVATRTDEFRADHELEELELVRNELSNEDVRYHFKSKERSVILLGDTRLEQGTVLTSQWIVHEADRRTVVLNRNAPQSNASDSQID